MAARVDGVRDWRIGVLDDEGCCAEREELRGEGGFWGDQGLEGLELGFQEGEELGEFFGGREKHSIFHGFWGGLL